MLQDGRVPDGARADLSDRGTPPAEAMERPEGTSWMRKVLVSKSQNQTRSKTKQEEVDDLVNPGDEVFTVQDEEDHESWRQFHRQKL